MGGCRARLESVRLTVDLDRAEIQSVLSLYHIDDLTDYGLVRTELFSTTYWVKALEEKYFLRVSLRRRFTDMVFEKDLLAYLRSQELSVPSFVENVASGAFTPWSSRGRYVTLFKFVEGRALGQFQLDSEHTKQIGDFLGRFHCLGDNFSPRKAKRDLLEILQKEIHRVQGRLSEEPGRANLTDAVKRLEGELAAQNSRSLQGPSGLHHGSLSITAAHFLRDKLMLVRDFSRSSHERFTLDLAIAINSWCWDVSSRQRGGPAGLYSPARLKAFLAAYTVHRPLGRTDYLQLADDLRLTALATAIHRIKNYETSEESDDLFEDYRHYTARLEALENKRAIELLEMTGLVIKSETKGPTA